MQGSEINGIVCVLDAHSWPEGGIPGRFFGSSLRAEVWLVDTHVGKTFTARI